MRWAILAGRSASMNPLSSIDCLRFPFISGVPCGQLSWCDRSYGECVYNLTAICTCVAIVRCSRRPPRALVAPHCDHWIWKSYGNTRKMSWRRPKWHRLEFMLTRLAGINCVPTTFDSNTMASLCCLVTAQKLSFPTGGRLCVSQWCRAPVEYTQICFRTRLRLAWTMLRHGTSLDLRENSTQL